MDLKDIKDRKNALRQDIAEQISKFEIDTGVIVNQVWIDRIEGGISEPDIISVILKIDLGN